jgi:outer membrane protein assembly factor BamB
LEDDLVLDFSETQFSFNSPMDLWFIFRFKATNVGTNDLIIQCNKYCTANPGRIPVGSPQAPTLLAPGESMWFKSLLTHQECAYDPSVSQTIERTICMEFVDENHNWEGTDNGFSLTKTIQINVSDYLNLEGSVNIQGTTVDEDGTPIPNVDIDVGGYGGKVPICSDDNGHFSYSIIESSTYFLSAQKEGYCGAYVEIDGSDIQPSYTVTLASEQTTSVNSVLMSSVTSNIGLWRCSATADENKLLLVGGMENWQDESIKPQTKLYLLDTNTGETLWTHDMGWESWSADITDDGKYVIFATKLEIWETGPEDFVNYIRLLNGTDGSTIWEKEVTSETFPATTMGEFYSRGVKFSHNGNYIFVSVYGEYAYLLNRADGSIKWNMWAGSEVREIAFSQNDQYVYVPSSGGWLYKVNTTDGSKVWKQWIACWPIVNGFDLSPNEDYIAVGVKGGTVTVINTANGTTKFTTEMHMTATCRFSADSTKVLVGGNLLTMFDLNGNVLWRCYQEGKDMQFSGDGKLVFTSNGGVYDCNGTFLYDILPGADRSSKVGWINSDATRYIFARQDTNSIEPVNVIEVYSIETTTETIPEFQGWTTILLMLVTISATLHIMKKRTATSNL